MSRKNTLLFLCALMLASSPAMAKKGFGHGGGSAQQHTKPAASQPAAPPSSSGTTQSEPAEPSAATKAQAQLDAVEKQLKSDFENSPELKAAEEEVKQAQANYDEAAKNALVSNDKYKAAQDKQKQIDAKIKEAEDNKDQPTVAQLAMDSLKNKNEIRQMELTAAVDDPAVKDAKEKLQTAQAKVMQMRRDFLASMQQNSDYIAAKKAVDDAKPTASR